MSIDGISGKKEATQVEAKASLKFNRRYIDNNLYSLHHHSGKNETSFPTDVGKKVSKSIASARKRLNLGKVRGCAPQTLYVNRAPYPSNANVVSSHPWTLSSTGRLSKMFSRLNQFISKLGDDVPKEQGGSGVGGAYGFQVLRNGNTEFPLEPWFDCIIGLNGRTIVCVPRGISVRSCLTEEL